MNASPALPSDLGNGAFAGRALALALAFALSACSGSGEAPTGDPPSDRAVLAVLVDAGVTPALTDMAETADGLQRSVERLCDRSSAADLDAARQAWREAYRAWREAVPFLYGPAKRLEVRRHLETWPVNEPVLDASATTPDVSADPNDRTIRGYGAVEYLLFTAGDATEASAPLRCAYLRELTGEIATRRTGQVRAAWAEAFRSEFVSAGDGEPFLTEAEALSLAYAQLLNVTEDVLRDRIGVASGFFVEPPRPEYLAAWRSGETVPAFQTTLAGLREALEADGEASLTRLVATRDGVVEAKDPQLAQAIGQQLDRITATLDRLAAETPDLHGTIQEEHQVLRPLYQRLQSLQEQLVEASLVLELDIRTPIEGLVTQP